MAVGERRDPVLSHNFEISLFDSASGIAAVMNAAAAAGVVDHPAGGFNECTGLGVSLDVEEYQEGGRNGTVLKFPTRVKHNPITLKRGLGLGSELWDWFHGFIVGNGRRRDGVIVVLDGSRQPHTMWGFRRGLPMRWDGPALNANQSAVSIEAVEIAHEGLFRLS